MVASLPWEFAGVNFVGPLSKSLQGNEYILDFKDYSLSGLRSAQCGKQLAMWLRIGSRVFARYGAPKQLVSDRDVQFVSDILESVGAAMGTVHRLNTADHPQSNQTERVNWTKTTIRAYAGSKHREWDRHLSLISFALRTAPHQSTGDSPALLLYSRDLNTPLDPWMQSELEPAQEAVEV